MADLDHPEGVIAYIHTRRGASPVITEESVDWWKRGVKP